MLSLSTAWSEVISARLRHQLQLFLPNSFRYCKLILITVMFLTQIKYLVKIYLVQTSQEIIIHHPMDFNKRILYKTEPDTLSTHQD